MAYKVTKTENTVRKINKMKKADIEKRLKQYSNQKDSKFYKELEKQLVLL